VRWRCANRARLVNGLRRSEAVDDSIVVVLKQLRDGHGQTILCGRKFGNFCDQESSLGGVRVPTVFGLAWLGAAIDAKKHRQLATPTPATGSQLSLIPQDLSAWRSAFLFLVPLSSAICSLTTARTTGRRAVGIGCCSGFSSAPPLLRHPTKEQASCLAAVLLKVVWAFPSQPYHSFPAFVVCCNADEDGLARFPTVRLIEGPGLSESNQCRCPSGALLAVHPS
jgi:hypothetical protein